ncbi:hypothetical protein I3F58_04130 [Streptomyces sp. MUM 203J]|uniref:hypothetical protein n=1 Tax=Streptomyces sp. MUM 203J TaxID=2791990 RepID=UPI001F04A5FF|nr:hypothetical protein [Streptomyces sp. MUM 203J]MCH0538758.1 hypothetical protein [Streptomyces sp. MUM 203J]
MRRVAAGASARKTAAGTAVLSVLATGALLGLVAAQDARAESAAPGGGSSYSYGFAEDARTLQGASSTGDAPPLEQGAVYRASLEKDATLIYRVDLDAGTQAYASAVAVPPTGTEIMFQDGIKVALQDQDGNNCSSTDTGFGSARFSRPIAAYASRRLDGKDGDPCQGAGSYFFVVERKGEDGSSADPWDVEIRLTPEPKLAEAGPTTAPSVWPSASPDAPAGGPRERQGGSGFHTAPGLEQGEWSDKIEPGESRFYRVPVDWGRQLFVSANLGSSPGDGYVSDALKATLYSPALGLVGSMDSLYYSGKQQTIAFEPLPPVAYENRFSSDTETSAMRFAGWYYLRVTLNPEVGEKFGDHPYGLTLKVDLEGKAEAGPRYAGDAGIFKVTEDDLRAAAEGQSGPQAAERGSAMRVLAVGGIGTGTVLLTGLGVWTLMGRRRAGGVPAGVPAVGEATVGDAATPTRPYGAGDRSP